MENKTANIIASTTLIALLILIIVTRVTLRLTEPFFLICGASVAVIVAVFAWLAIRRHYGQAQSKLVSEGRELKIEYSFLRKVAGVPTKFRRAEIEEATENFRTLLGRGASASVFRGVLRDGTVVAVKRIGGEERGEREFRSEVAAIASVQHVNLVRMLGFCTVPNNGHRFLVYDYVVNGSLDCWIFPKRGGGSSRSRRTGCLSWDLRYKVARDVAKALAYLHHDCRSRVLHLDVKPENILLDENFNAVVADFGLSKLMGKDESRVLTTIRGTRGYLAPEWLLEHGISEKSDIYSFGMVLLEMIGGRRNITFIEHGENSHRGRPNHRKWQYFPKIVNEKMREGKVMEVVDPRLIDSGGVDEREVKRLAYVAMWCIQERARARPTMAQVVEMLDGRVVVDMPPDSQMVIIDLLSDDDDEIDQATRAGRSCPRRPTLAAYTTSPRGDNRPRDSSRGNDEIDPAVGPGRSSPSRMIVPTYITSRGDSRSSDSYRNDDEIDLAVAGVSQSGPSRLAVPAYNTSPHGDNRINDSPVTTTPVVSTTFSYTMSMVSGR